MTVKKHTHPKQSNQQPDRTATQEKRFQQRSYSIIIGLFIFAGVYYYFISPETIGHDARYEIYIVWLPIMIGMVVLAIYRRRFLLDRFISEKGFSFRVIMAVFYLVQGVIFSCFSFGQLAAIGWDAVNYKVAKQSELTTIDCPVTMFRRDRKSNSVDFMFNNNYDHFNVSTSTISEYWHKNPNDYIIRITAQKGIWNYYLVQSWSIRKR